jgi:hypothetical protein
MKHGAALILFLDVTRASGQEPETFLKTYAAFSEQDVSRVEGGQVVVKVLSTGVKNEAAVVGAARIRATTEFFLRMYRDIERFETGWGVTKKLSEPPRIEDFDAFQIPEEDLKALRDCKLSDCDVKMGKTGLDYLQANVDWDDPRAQDQLLRFFRERMLEYSKGYLSGGNSALAVLRDKDQPAPIADSFTDLLERSSYILQYRPELHRYLLDYPKATLPGASGFLYWSVVDFGPKPTVRLAHVTIYPLPEGAEGPNRSVVIASKQLYFSHYFSTGLELYALVKDRERPDDGFYLVTINRYRTDLPSGMFGKMAMKTATDSTRSSLERYLTSTQAAVDQYFRDERAR